MKLRNVNYRYVLIHEVCGDTSLDEPPHQANWAIESPAQSNGFRFFKLKQVSLILFNSNLSLKLCQSKDRAKLLECVFSCFVGNRAIWNAIYSQHAKFYEFYASRIYSSYPFTVSYSIFLTALLFFSFFSYSSSN